MLFPNMTSKAREKKCGIWSNRKNTVMAPDFAVGYDPYRVEIAAFASKPDDLSLYTLIYLYLILTLPFRTELFTKSL